MPPIDSSYPKRNLLVALAAILTVLAAAALLRIEGRVWWCEQGDWAVYVGDAWNSRHTSQHLIDPYTLTHILHGVGLFWITGLVFSKVSTHWRLYLAIAIESGWELLENSDFIIERYRANTASFDYLGDSVANSISDIAACALGFVIASRLGNWWSLLFFIAVEIFLVLAVRDSLLINILMLLYPLQSVRQWQLGG